MQRGDGRGPLFLRDLDVCTELQGFHARLARIRAIQLRESRVVLTLIHEETDKACVCSSVIRVDLQVFAIRGNGFRLLLRFETFRQATKSVCALGLNFQGAAESDFRFRRLAGTEARPAQVL